MRVLIDTTLLPSYTLTDMVSPRDAANTDIPNVNWQTRTIK